MVGFLAVPVIAGVRIAGTLATKLGPKAIKALRKMDKDKARNLINKAKNAFKSKDTKRIDNIKNQIDKNKKVLKKETDIQKKYVEAGNVKKIKNLKGKETKLQKEKNILEKKRLAKKENIKKKVTSTADLVGRASTIPLILDKSKKKKENKPVDNTKTETKTNEIAPPKLSNKITIKKGDTLSQIAKDTPGVTLGAIKKANPNINLNKISIGQKINMPKEEDLSPDRKSVYQDIDMSEITMKKKYGGKIVRRKTNGIIGGGAALRGFGATRRR